MQISGFLALHPAGAAATAAGLQQSEARRISAFSSRLLERHALPSGALHHD